MPGNGKQSVWEPEVLLLGCGLVVKEVLIYPCTVGLLLARKGRNLLRRAPQQFSMRRDGNALWFTEPG